MLDVYRNEVLPIKINGEVRQIEKFKGGGVLLTIRKSGNRERVSVDKHFYGIIKKRDYFEKMENSNKCLIKRNDSIIYLDCFNISKEIKDSLKIINEWPKSKTGYWQKDI